MAPKRKTKSPQLNAATQAAYEQFASEFIDLLLVPENEWLRCYFLKGGFTRPIQSISELASNIVQSIDAEVIMSAELFDALQSGDRKYLIGYVKTNLREPQLSVAELSRILRSLNSSKLRKTIIQAGNIFPAYSGPAPKIPDYKHQEIAVIGLQLAPVIENLLIGRDRHSRHSTEDSLKHEMTIRVDVNADGTSQLTTKMTSGAGGYAPDKLTKNVTVTLSKEQTKWFLGKIEQYKFWQLPSVQETIGPRVWLPARSW